MVTASVRHVFVLGLLHKEVQLPLFVAKQAMNVEDQCLVETQHVTLLRLDEPGLVISAREIPLLHRQGRCQTWDVTALILGRELRVSRFEKHVAIAVR